MDDLFSWKKDFLGSIGGHSRNTDPNTSHKAGKSIKSPPRRGSMAYDVLIVHSKFPDGLTDEELGDRMPRHIHDNCHRKRRADLRDLGFIEDGGQERITRTGESAIVWRVTQKGIDFLKN